MKNIIRISALTVSLFLFGFTGYAQQNKNSDRLKQLPPGHQLRSAFNGLPPQAKVKAENWLNSFSFPDEDFNSINMDTQGGVFYVEPLSDLTQEAGSVENGDPEVADITAAEIFTLHSRPGAPNVVHLDFDGHVITGTAWNGTFPTLYAKPYDSDGNIASFSAAEINNMAAIWHRVADDFALFDIDVTTEAPAGGYGPNVGHVLITDRTDANGNLIYPNSAGGVAYVGVWGRSNYEYYQPALVFENALGNGWPHYVAEASSHEFGHNLALSHDGISGGETYYAGHGSGNIGWAPIMGVGYYQSVTQWSNGNYTGANNTQNDITIIGNYLGYSNDDHGNTLAGATALYVTGDGAVNVTDPETDPYNTVPFNKGIIGSSTDIDFFFFETSGGEVTLTVKPAWQAYYADRRGSDLDVKVTLYNNAGGSLGSYSISTDTKADISVNLGAGKYYLGIEGEGSINYNDYGSLGFYYISGTISGNSGNLPPTADFTFNITELKAAFADASTDSDGTVAGWSWDFGDGNGSSQQNPSHTYSSPGTYTVTLTATDNDGAIGVKSQQVTVNCTDTDGDGVCDGNDGCPDDPNKIAPGDCGCGVADTDTDLDGIADCDDQEINSPCPDNVDANGVSIDSDNDGVADCKDICIGFDDNIDTDGDGLPDGCDPCTLQTTNFTDNPLTHTGTGSGSTTLTFPADSKDVSFTVSNLSSKTRPTSKDYIEKVTVEFNNGITDILFDAFTDADGTSVFIDIPGAVYSVTVFLTDGGDGNSGSSTMSVSLSSVNYCIGQVVPCDDSDGDGVCDDIDGCPNDPLKADPGQCGCGNPDTDSDGDGTADCNDLCPGDPNKTDPGDCGCGNIDTPGCVDCNPQTDQFGDSQLTHSGTGESTVTLDFPDIRTDVSFTISRIDVVKGKPSTRYTEIVTVTYVDGNGSTHTYNSFSGDNVSSANILIPGSVTSVTVHLEDGYNGNSGSTISVDIGEVTSCSGTANGKSAIIGQDNGLSDVKEITLYPNPSDGQFYLEGLSGKVDVKIFSSSGEHVRTVFKVDRSIDISDLASGFYYISFITQDQRVVNKIVIKN